MFTGLDSLDIATKGAGGYLHPSAVRRNLNYLNYFLGRWFLSCDDDFKRICTI